MKRLKKPRRYYALCLGTLPKEEAFKVRDLLKHSRCCNVEFKMRGRGKNRPRTTQGNKLTYPYKDYLPLKLSTDVAIYVTLKRSLKRQVVSAEVRDRLLEATGQRQ